MVDYPDIESRRRALEEALMLESVHPASLRVAKRSGRDLEVELNIPGRAKRTFFVQWTDYPSRKGFAGVGSRNFADAENRTSPMNFLYVAADIGKPLATDLRKWRVNHADLNGRLFLAGNGFYIHREPLIREHSNPVAEPSLFTAKACRIVRYLLTERDLVWTQDELVGCTQNSRGYVSRILGILVNEGYVEKIASEGRQYHYRLREFDRLLDAWAREDTFSKRVKRFEYSLLTNDPMEIAGQVRGALEGSPYYFTQWIAAWLRKPYTTPPVVSVYVPASEVPRFPIGRRVSGGGNLWLLVPEDSGVFQGNRYVDGFPLVCDPQIYLDLVGSGLRGPEAADALRQWGGFAK